MTFGIHAHSHFRIAQDRNVLACQVRLLSFARQYFLTLPKGLPMGIGAGFKLKEKEREKQKERDRDKEPDPLERKLSSRRGNEQDKEEGEEPTRPRSRHRSLRHHSYRRSNEDEDPSSHDLASHDRHGIPHQQYGWTSMLEDWYCHTHGQAHGQDFNGDPTSREGHEGPSYTDSGGALSPKAKSTGDLNARLNAFREGPYELLVKERMMGIYLAVFVHRDIKDLVESASSRSYMLSYVTKRLDVNRNVEVSSYSRTDRWKSR